MRWKVTLVNGCDRWEEIVHHNTGDGARRVAEVRNPGSRAIYADIAEEKQWTCRNEQQSSSSSDGDGGGCLLLLLLFGGIALVKYLPYILAAAAIGGGLWLVLSALASED